MLRIITIVLACSLSFAQAWSVNLGSGSCGSGSRANGPVVTKYKKFQVGKVTVGVPEDDNHKVIKTPDGSWVWSYGGNQVFSSQAKNILADHGITQKKLSVIGDWGYTWGNNGNCVVYVAAHKTTPNLYVYGSAISEEAIKVILDKIVVETQPTAQTQEKSGQKTGRDKTVVKK